MRFEGLAYRAHDPRWSFKPLSGDGAAVHGGRFNPKGTPALYVALDPMTAIKEAAQGFARKFEPCVLCTYEIDCEDVVDLRREEERQSAGVSEEDMACPWFAEAAAGCEPASWRLARRLIASGAAGLIAPSFVRGAVAGDVNLVLWDWSDRLPHKVAVYDPAAGCRKASSLGFGPRREKARARPISGLSLPWSPLMAFWLDIAAFALKALLIVAAIGGLAVLIARLARSGEAKDKKRSRSARSTSATTKCATP